MPRDPSSIVLGSLAVAVLAVAVEPFWAWTRHLVTLVHETGHAVLLLITGAGVRDLVVHRAGGGATMPRSAPWWPGWLAALLAGYAAPPVTGLVLAGGLGRGWPAATMLGVLLLVLLAVALLHGNWFALVVVLLVGAVLALAFYRGGPQSRAAILIGLAWLLLIGGFRRVLEIAVRPTPADSDQAELARLTGLPALVWVAGFVGIAGTCLVIGARTLLVLRP